MGGRQEGGVSGLDSNAIKKELHSGSTIRGAKLIVLGLSFYVFFTLLAACAPGAAIAPDPASSGSGGAWDNAIKVISPEYSRVELLGDGGDVEIDISNRDEGYITAHYTGSSAKVKLILSKDGGQSPDYIFDLTPDGYDVLPLSGGSGAYAISVNENIEGERYAVIFSDVFSASIADEYRMYLYPNQYVSFSSGSASTLLAERITADAPNAFKAVENIYNFVVENIAYDTEKALLASQGQMAGYLPDIDKTLAEGSGICFDYAAAAAAMLRSQGIPARLVIGYSGQAYHAWIEVHIDGQGAVGPVRFDGEAWVLLDPTFAAAYAAAGATPLAGDGENYNPLYYY